MKSLRKAFRKQFAEEKDAVYVFLISGVHKTNLTGYMPLKGQYGFIFTKNQSETETAHTIAHEIGHGAFYLRHTFSPKNKYVLSQNTTDNLMDYTPDGKVLNKYQWDQIHDPENLLFSWLENEAEGEMINILSLVESIREANKKNYNIIEIMQDKCPQGFYKNKKIGDYQLGGLQINCSKEFEGAEIKEETKNTWLTWKLNFAEKAMIMPNENKQIFVQTNLGKAVYFQFHEVKTSDKVPLANELSDNLLFEFAVLEKDALNFETYLFPKPLYFIEFVKFICQTDAVINGLDCHWCSTWNKCCNGDKERIKDKANNLVCEAGFFQTNNCCFATSKYMIEQSGNMCGNKKLFLEDYFVNLVNENDCRDGVTSNIIIESNKIITLAKKKIKHNIPILAGVFYDFNVRPNDEKKPKNLTADNQKSPTNHFVVIVGYGIDKDGKEYFRFYDPASSNSGNSIDNKLYFDNKTNIVKGTRFGDTSKKYILTEIRIP